MRVFHAKAQSTEDYIITLPDNFYVISGLCGLKIRFGIFAALRLCVKIYFSQPQLVLLFMLANRIVHIQA
jgi:hypothetical protein